MSGPWFALPRSPWPAPFSPPPPPVLAHQHRCSGASPILWGCPTSHIRPSRSYPLGSPCGPQHLPGPDVGSPDSRATCLCACLGSSTPPGAGPPRRSGVPAVAFRVLGARRHPDWPISGLHTLPARSPVNASRGPLPSLVHDSGPAWFARPSLWETCTPSHRAGLSQRIPNAPGELRPTGENPRNSPKSLRCGPSGYSRRGDRSPRLCFKTVLAGFLAHGSSVIRPLSWAPFRWLRRLSLVHVQTASVIRPLSWAPFRACDLHFCASPSRVIPPSLNGVLTASAARLVPTTYLSPSPRQPIRWRSPRPWLLGESHHRVVSG